MSVRKIVVLGYYHRKNLGDDVFEYVLTNYFQRNWPGAEYSFISIDSLKQIPDTTSVVLFGGGGLVGDYFFKKIDKFIKHKTCPWYTVSLGITYPNLVDMGRLDRFDYIMHRSQVDTEQLQDRYSQRSEWFPDMSYLLLRYNQQREVYYKTNCYGSKKIGICLARSIVHINDPDSYSQLVDTLARFLSDLSKMYRLKYGVCGKTHVPLYELYFLPFCTDEKKSHDDRYINQDVYDKMMDYGVGDFDNIHVREDEIHMDEILPIFNSFHLTICTRFHAHMFSLMTQTPILSIYGSRKVDNLVSEIGSERYAYNIHSGQLTHNLLMDKFVLIESEYDTYKCLMTTLHDKYNNNIDKFVSRLDNLIFYGPRYVLPDEIQTMALRKSRTIARKLLDINKPAEDIVENLLDAVNNKLAYVVTENSNNNNNNNITDLIYKSGSIKKLFKKHSLKTKSHIVEIISYELTGIRNSDYHYGLSQKVFTSKYNLLESCKWILNNKYELLNNDNYKYLDNTQFSREARKIDITHINNNLFYGYHRSGWNYVLQYIEEIHNPNGVIFDSYLDKTFGWEYDFLTVAQVIPYRKNWIGVFHHTSDEDYTENNLANVFRKDNFIRSLKCCKGLILLSLNNKIWVENELEKLGFSIPVINLCHPTELLSRDKMFNYNLFKTNPAKKVIQIGAWLRNSYSIYELDVPSHFHKYALKGRDMDNYFISDQDVKQVDKCLRKIACGNKERTSKCKVENKDANKYIVGLIDMIKNNHTSVTVLEHVSNDQYDQLLKDNVVFINLVDASAVNTILECIVRNTPILVNRLLATEEYLGCNYPLFYDNLDEATALISNCRNIKKAYLYLRNLDKTKFKVKYFLESLVDSDMYTKLEILK
jgi:hypothetical protein